MSDFNETKQHMDGIVGCSCVVVVGVIAAFIAAFIWTLL